MVSEVLISIMRVMTNGLVRLCCELASPTSESDMAVRKMKGEEGLKGKVGEELATRKT